jgi:hypothetical protein
LKADTRTNSKASSKILYSAEQGIILAEQGILVQEQAVFPGKSEIITGISFSGTHKANNRKKLFNFPIDPPCQFAVNRVEQVAAIPLASTTASGPKRCALQLRRPFSAQPGPPAACRV